jgi:hypothetical protein
MACNTGRCALRRFDGHGSGSYRPSNSALASENEKNLAALMSARNKLDSDLGFSGQKDLPLASGKPEDSLILASVQKPELVYKPDNFTTWKTPSASNWQKK